MRKSSPFAGLVISVLALAACERTDAPSSEAKGAAGAQNLASAPCGQSPCRHVHDAARALPPADLPRFEHYMGNVLRESDVDVRLAFVPDTGGRTIEELAVDLVGRMRIGGKTREERGVLLLYDMGGHRLKIEVGYGLEAYFPDAFVSYLVREHARMFFESGDVSLGLRLMLRLLQHRIREAVIGADFDPRVLDAVRAKGHLSGGAGVTAAVQSGSAPGAPEGQRMSEEERARYGAQPSPDAAYRAYLEWLALPLYDPDIDLFTEASRKYLAGLRMSPAYKHFILFGEYGKRYAMVERDDLAILYFTGTPFTSPHFFVNENGIWRMDMRAEVANTVERVGGIYTWDYRGQSDRHTLAFPELLADIKGYRRFKDGDNRPLVIRGSKGL